MAVDTIISPKQIAIIENSFAALKDNSLDVAISFYENLFQDYPQLKRLFANTDMTKQYQKFVDSLSYIVKHLAHPSLLTNAVKTMGVKHASYGVLPEHYPRFGNALLKTLKLHFKTQWSPELEAAWTAAYTAIAYLMLEASERASDAEILTNSDSFTIVEPKTNKPAIANSFIASEDIAILEDSFIPIKDNSADFTATFYDLLCIDNPQMKQAIGQLDIAAQEQKFIGSWLSLIESLRNPKLLDRAIGNVKTIYTSLGIAPDSYPLVKKALLKSLKFYLGPGWTQRVESAWIALTELSIKELLKSTAKQETPQIKQPQKLTASPEELNTDRFDRGEEKLNQIYNKAGDRLAKSLRDIAPDLSRYIIEYGYGEIYSRPGLDLKSRQIAAISALVVLGNSESQLMDNLHGALNVGCTETEIVETILQMSMFAGFPPVLRALEVAKIVFAERD